ncbi:hypothetical protein [Streptomyces sp. AF1A]|uniref:5'-methylthioadenosine/S-adenosylhomocysteine nucleosidase family protein n=1 Tax=Streptomyces sp. AF1A TaxID=3394350 RepID=UPI0039BC7CC8
MNASERNSVARLHGTAMLGKGADMGEASSKVVVLTALPLEYQAVRRLIENPRRVDHAGTIFECGRLTGTSYIVYLAATGPGNDSAAAITERAVSFVRPRAVFFTGIAGALKADVSPGDVVVATEVHAYHGGKQDPEGFMVRPRSWEASYELQQVAHYVASVGSWRQKLPEAAQTSTTVHFKPIVAGDVVLNAPQESPLRVFLDRYYNGAVAVEMEGAGFASAAHKAQAVPHLMVRGVSDRADGTKQSTDDAGLQEAAALHAALFLAEVIAQLQPTAPLSDPLPTAGGTPSDQITWRTLGGPAAIKWRRDLIPAQGFGTAPALLEVHLVPVPPPTRVPAVRMRQLADELVQLGRTEGLFTVAGRVETLSTAEVALAAVADPRGSWAGLAITRSGQRSAWMSLPKPGITYVVDEEDTRDRIAALAQLLLTIGGPAADSYAPAVGIENTMLVTVERLHEVDPHRSKGLRGTDTPIRVEPEEVVTASAVAKRGPNLANELTARLLYALSASGR